MNPIHFSTLKLMGRSPLHAKFSLDGGQGESTSSKLIGTAAHTLALGTGQRVVTYEGRRDMRTKAYQEFLAENKDAVILNAAEFAKASGMARSLEKNRGAMRYLAGIREVPMEWEWLGRRCATRGIDAVDSGVPGEIRFLTELKTTKFAKPEWFTTEVVRRGYAEQLCFYENAVGVPVPELVIVAVESSPPHPVVVYVLSRRMRDQAERRLRLWMEQFLSCERSDSWPGYVETVIEMDTPDELSLDWGDDEAA